MIVLKLCSETTYVCPILLAWDIALEMRLMLVHDINAMELVYQLSLYINQLIINISPDVIMTIKSVTKNSTHFPINNDPSTSLVYRFPPPTVTLNLVNERWLEVAIVGQP